MGNPPRMHRMVGGSSLAKVRLRTSLVVIAVLSTPLAYLTNSWRREEREAEARRLVLKATARKQRADEYRGRQRRHLKLLDGLRRSKLAIEEAKHSKPRVFVGDSRRGMLYLTSLEAQIDHAGALASWEGEVATLLDWAADHPSEHLRPEPPMPTLEPETIRNPAASSARDAGKGPVEPSNAGRHAVPRIVKKSD